MIDIVAYLLGFFKGKAIGVQEVVIEGGITCTDDGNGNVTITED